MRRKRVDYLATVRQLRVSRLVFLDETGTNVTMTRLNSRAKRGHRAFGKAPRNHRVNLTVIGAIALDGVRALMAYEGATTKHSFLHFVRTVLVPSLHKGDVVVMDNLRAHYAQGVEQAIEAVGATVLYLPPYSPELNPIEQTWSKLKSILRKIGARTLRALAGALALCRSEITPSDIRGWFRHSGYEAHSI